jgi:hypothetical protein
MEDYVNHALETSILNQLITLFESGKLCSALIGKKKKRKLDPPTQNIVLPIVPNNQIILKPNDPITLKKPNDVGSIYDDDIVMDKYVPVGSIDEAGGAIMAPPSISVDPSVYAANLSVRATLKGLFDHKTSAPVVKTAAGNTLLLRLSIL